MGIDAKEFKKGNSLIVGKKIKGKENEYEIDGVLVYDAYCLSSSKPFLLQCSNIKFNIDEPIYICGHGKKLKISGYTMQDIAKMLISNTNVSQMKKIIIISCYGKHKNRKGHDMASLLKKELSELGVSIEVESVAKYTTIVVDYFNKALVVDKKYFECLFSTHQTNLQHRLGCLELIVNNSSATIRQQLDDYFSQYGKDIAVHNYALISKGKDNKMESSVANYFILILLAIICLGIGIYRVSIGILDGYTRLCLVSTFIFLIILLIYSGFVEWCIDCLKDLKNLIKK